jgi:hypothetical protein
MATHQRGEHKLTIVYTTLALSTHVKNVQDSSNSVGNTCNPINQPSGNRLMDGCHYLGGESKSTVSGYDRRNNNQVPEGERQVGDYREIMGREDDMSSSQNAAQNRFLGGTDL